MTSLLHNFGVRGRLLLAFFGISGLAVLGAVVALFAFGEVGAVLDRVTRERMPAGFASLELSRQVERIVSAAPSLLTSQSEEEQARTAEEIGSELAELDRLLSEVKRGNPDPTVLSSIGAAVDGIRRNLAELEKLVADRLALVARRNDLLGQLSLADIAAQRIVGPGLVLFDSRMAQWRRAASDASPDEQARAAAMARLATDVAGVLPQQKAQVEIAALHDGLIRAAGATESDLPLIEFNLQRSLSTLDGLAGDFDPILRQRFNDQIAEFRKLVEGPDSLLDLRNREIALVGQGERLIQENADLSGKLTAAVDRLVSGARGDIAMAEDEVRATQRTSAGVLIGVVTVSLLSSTLIVWLYVGRNLIGRLTALSNSMLAIAGGHLRTALPAPGRDEIGQMASALRVFRDTAVEVEDQSLRERQVVLDTIEYGVLILDPELKVRMHNRAFRDLWGVSEKELRNRPPVRRLLNAMRGRGLHAAGDAEWETYVELRLAEIATGDARPQEWARPDGRVLQYEIVALPDGGRMLTYFDLTHLKQVETELRAASRQAELRSRELAQSLENLRATQDRLVQTEKLASLGQLTAGIAHEIKNPLNFVNNFSALSGELVGELREVLEGAGLDEKTQAEVEALSAMLKGNLDKVVLHGKRADSIVKNMLLHSRQGSGEHRPSDINAIVEESLNLAYHGARAEKQGFNITLEKSLDPEVGQVDLYPQEITRVLINLISNGFYATAKRNREANGAAYDPTLAVATRNLGDSVEIRIRDNGTGIPPEVKEKMFDPFFTTKPAGEGTGLGLSLSHDIIVKQHAGMIEVETEPGAFTEFRIVLPRGAASLGKSGGEV